MYSFNNNPSGDSDSRLESNSIWNSAGLAADFNPNLPSLPNNPLQHFQNFAQLNNLTPLPVPADAKVPPRFGFDQQLWKESDGGPQHVSPKLLSQYSNEQSCDAGGTPTANPPTSAASPSVVTPMFVPDAPAQNLPSASPTPTTNKDPGYFSESECSSNSSEKDNLSASFAKSLHIDPYAPINIPIKSPASSKPSLESIPTAETSPVANVLNEDIINVLSRYDPQSFDPQDFQFTGDESWKIIKKPGKEADIVPDLSSPDSVPYVPSEGSWSGASSPSIGSPWNAEPTKPSFVQSTKQQVCVFCRNNGEDASVYTTHTLMSTAGKVICPILFAYKCPICHATGDYAHTLKYCPMMPKGISTSTTTTPPPSASRAPSLTTARPTNLARLPKTATFPKHLSSSAKAAMSIGPASNMTKSSFQASRGRTVRAFPPAQQIQQIQQTSAGSADMSSIADLREAAQKILMFTNQVMQNQPQGNQMNPRNPPQVAQFLLKVDKNKQAPSQNFNHNESKNRGFFGAQNQSSNSNVERLVELLTASSTPTGQGYQPFPTSPLQFGSQDTDPGTAFNTKLQELLTAASPSDLPSNSLPDSSNRFRAAPTSLPQGYLQVKSHSTSSSAASSAFSPSFNVSAPAFVPNFSSAAASEGGVNDSASAEIFKMLGINKTSGGSVNTPKEDVGTPEPNKENTLANILANIKEYQNLNSG